MDRKKHDVKRLTNSLLLIHDHFQIRLKGADSLILLDVMFKKLWVLHAKWQFINVCIMESMSIIELLEVGHLTLTDVNPDITASIFPFNVI